MPTKARVLMLVANLPVPPDRRVWYEAMALTAAGYEVSVICPKGKGYTASQEVIEGVHIHRYSLPFEGAGAFGFLVEYSLTMFWATMLSLRIACTRGFDVIHACNPPDLYFVLGWFYRLFGKRFIFDHHDLCPELYETKFKKRGLMYRVMVLLDWLTFKTARVVLATNESFHQVAVERGGVKPEQVFIVRSAPDRRRFRRLEVAKNQDALMLGYVGIMGSQDGVESFIYAMHDIVQQRGRDAFRAVLVGDGSELPKLKALTKDLQINDVVTFTGYLGGEELLRAYSSFDIGVIPDPKTVYTDKITMNKTLEFMAMDIPFVLFSLDQSCQDAGEAGFVASAHTPKALAEAILAVADDSTLRARMVQACRRRTEDLSWEATEKNLLAAYEEALA